GGWSERVLRIRVPPTSCIEGSDGCTRSKGAESTAGGIHGGLNLPGDLGRPTPAVEILRSLVRTDGRSRSGAPGWSVEASMDRVRGRFDPTWTGTARSSTPLHGEPHRPALDPHEAQRPQARSSGSPLAEIASRPDHRARRDQ